MRALLLVILIASRLCGSDAQPTAAVWGSEPQTGITATRGEIVLNGLWRFAPITGATSEPTQWGWAAVPGSWAYSQEWWGAPLGHVVAPGGGAWDGEAGKAINRAYYEREILIPAAWQGRRVVVRLERVATDARVSLDGVVCGDVAWPSGEADLTAAAKPGTRQRLRIFVVATPEQGEVRNFMETADRQVSTSKAALVARGLVEDVVLASRPLDASISDVFVQPSVRKKRIVVTVELNGVTAAGTITAEARFSAPGADAVERTFTATAAVKDQPKQTIDLAWEWPDPRLWDTEHPELYDLRLHLRGAGIDDEAMVTFGFREFWIEGREFRLNGLPIRLRPTLAGGSGYPACDEAALQRLRERGFNFIELWPNDTWYRSFWSSDRWLIDACNRSGMLISARAGYMNHVAERLDDPAVMAEFRQRAERDMRRYRNDPAVVMWGSSGNYFGHEDDQDPRKVGQTAWLKADERWSRRAAMGRRGITAMKAIDPTRPVFTHMGAAVGDVFTTNMYLNLMPLQEREEWLSEWAKRGDMPFMAVEFEMPIDLTLRRGRGSHVDANTSEPLVTEFAAIHLGPRAYELERPGYRAAMLGDAWRGGDEWRYGQPGIAMEPAAQQLFVENIHGLWRHWRTWGLSGGMIPWSNGHATADDGSEMVPLPWQPGQRGWWRPQVPARDLSPTASLTPAGEAFRASNSDTLAWICGPAERFWTKDHAFRVGAKLTKSIGLVSDRRSPTVAQIAWSVHVGGTVIAQGNQEVALKPGEIRFVPIGTTLATAGDGEIVLRATMAGRVHDDRFAIRIHGPTPAAPAVALFDPAGETATMLRALGIRVQMWKPGEPVPPVLVIGRRAFTEHLSVVPEIAAAVEAGARVLVMAQEREVLSDAWGLRVSGHLERRAFAAIPGHALLDGLSDGDLRDWAGESRLLDPRPTEHVLARTSQPLYGWRWGGTGAISSAAIEVPHRAGWRPLLVCGFDLQYSPLCEVDLGRGRVTICTLDLEDHAASDAGAARLAANLLRHVATGPLAPRLPTIYLGDDRGAELLRACGVQADRSTSVPSAPAVVILGAGAAADPAALAASGLRVLVLPRSSDADLVAGGKDFAGEPGVPTWQELAGVVPGMLRSRVPVNIPVLAARAGREVAGGGLVARERSGTGVVIRIQADPMALDTVKITPLRLTAWRWTRVICQVAANLGARCEQDGLFWQDHRKDPPVRLELSAVQWRARQTDPRPAHVWNGRGLEDPGITPAAREALEPGFDDAAWPVVRVPGQWEHFGGAWGDATSEDGEAVFRATVQVPASWAGKDLELCLGTVDDSDTTVVDGQVVGENRYNYDKRRVYRIPGERVRGGPMAIAVRVWDWCGGGGFTGAAEDVCLRIADHVPPPGPYHPDYRSDFKLGDDPYRYSRW